MVIERQIVETEWAGRKIAIETGTLAKQANGAVTVRYGDTVVLVTAVASPTPREGIDFFPLTVDYEEKMYAVGKIPGSRFIRREGRPSDRAILTGRLIDRSIRPLFPKGALNDVQVVVTTLSVDLENSDDIPGLIGASAALMISDIPWRGPICGAKVGLRDDQFILNPTYEDIEVGGLELVVAGHADGVIMIEGGARELPEESILTAIEFAHQSFGPILELQQQLAAKFGKPKKEFVTFTVPDSVLDMVSSAYQSRVEEVVQIGEKSERDNAINTLRDEAIEKLTEQASENALFVSDAVELLVKKQMRAQILKTGKRTDGRGSKDIRPISCSISLLPRAHGSGLFVRGETQAITVTTLASLGEEKLLNDLTGEESKRYLHHYNFPPFSTGEVKTSRGPGRREIGHGALAERSLEPVIPPEELFPYTIRVVSEILSSNGSTSMASVCGSTLSLMDAGVPITAPVAGISIGLITGENSQRLLITDIQGIEDFYGDMDFKVAGTRRGVTGIQLDLKLDGLPTELFKEALDQAREARAYILDRIAETIPEPRAELSPYAPRILTTSIPQDRIGELIGPGGKNVRALQERFGVKVDIEEDGTVFISSTDVAGAEAAKNVIDDMMREVEIGEVYTGRITRILPIGAFVEILPGKEGLVHISQWDWQRTERMEDVATVGDELTVKVVDIDDQNRINLSRKALLPRPAGVTSSGGGGGGGGRRPGGFRGPGGDRPRRDFPPRRPRY